MATNIMTASHQWATRPDDQRFISLAELHDAVAKRRQESWTATPRPAELRAMPGDDGGLWVSVNDRTSGRERYVTPSHWGMGQLASLANCSAKELRKFPAEIAAINLQYGLEFMAARDNALVLSQSNGEETLRSITSTSYGRIWDQKVVEAVMRVNSDGRWQIPAASYSQTDPRRATTLYASDRDVFIFLVDPDHDIQVGKDLLHKGFIVWNSEVGSDVFGMTTFLYNRVCDNRIIWGATNVKELRIRHTGGAPDRFAYEGKRYLEQYSRESNQQIIDAVAIAQETEIPVKNEKTVADWLKDRGFTKEVANKSVEYAQAEEGSVRTVWDIIQGVTAYARSVKHTDARVELESKAGSMLSMVAGR